MHWAPFVAGAGDNGAFLPRFGHSAVALRLEAAPGRGLHDFVIVYGGVGVQRGSLNDAQTALGDVVVLHVSPTTWFAPRLSGAAAPGPRAFHCAAAVGSIMYMFGGHILTFDAEQNRKRRNFFNDIWQLDAASWEWSRVEADPSSSLPPRRDMGQLLAVGGGSLLLFGGRSDQGRALADSWLFDTATRCWTQLQPEGGAPPPRKMHAMAQVNNQVVLFGGERDQGTLDDLWILSGLPLGSGVLRWTQVRSRPVPAARFGHTLVLGRMEGGGHVALFGGCLDLSNFLSLARNYVQSRELWVLDMARLSWVKVAEAEAGGSSAEAWPSERMCATITRLPDGRVLLLGGRRKEGICEDDWWLDVDDDLLTPPAASAMSATATWREAAVAAAAFPAAAAPPTPTSPSLFSVLPGLRLMQSSSGRQRDAPSTGVSATTTPTASRAGTPRHSQSQLLPPLPPAAVAADAAGAAAAGAAVAAAMAASFAPPLARGSSAAALQSAAAASAVPPAQPLHRGNSTSSLQAAAAAAAVLPDWARRGVLSPGGALTRLSNSFTSSVSSVLAAAAAATVPEAALPSSPLPPHSPRRLFAQQQAAAAAVVAAPDPHQDLTQLRTLLRLPEAPDAPAYGAAATAAARAAAADLDARLLSLGQRLLGQTQQVQQPQQQQPQQPQQRQQQQQQQQAAGLAPDVLLSAARQHLAGSAPERLALLDLQLLLADYQAAAARHHWRALAARLQSTNGTHAASVAACLPASRLAHTAFAELRLADVAALQAAYSRLLHAVPRAAA